MQGAGTYHYMLSREGDEEGGNSRETERGTHGKEEERDETARRRIDSGR